MLAEHGKWEQAIACYARALELEPNYPDALNNLGIAPKEVGRVDDAVACYRRAVELETGFSEAYYNLGNVLRSQGKSDEASASYRRALDANHRDLAALGSLVHELQEMCQWQGLDVLARRLIEGVDAGADRRVAEPAGPFAFLSLPIATTAQQQLRCARQWVEAGLGYSGSTARSLPLPARSPNKPKITVGYLSADFQSHATTVLMAELLEKHDHQRFTIVGYSYGADDKSPMRQRVASAFDRFVDVRNLSYVEAAERIAADEVDILIDLKGYTADARTQIAMLRPAPIQVNYLGYPGTMGAPFIDYILVDDFVVPADQQPYFTEKLVHLPGCYQVNDSRREIASQAPSRAACGLPDTGFVFCSFNNTYKITAEIFAVWMRLLDAVPGSVLWLLEANRFAVANLRSEAKAHRIAPERLVFAPRTAPAEHLARHRLADLFLDTLPYNAHTTASDSLWAGCPLVTIAGETFASRVAGSLLRDVGLSELITTSLGEYEALALRLARDPSKLAELRAAASESKHVPAIRRRKIRPRG